MLNDSIRGYDLKCNFKSLVLRSTSVHYLYKLLIFYLDLIKIAFNATYHSPGQTQANGRNGLTLLGVVNFDDKFVGYIWSYQISTHNRFNREAPILS